MRLKSFDNFLMITMSGFALISLYMLYGQKIFSFHLEKSEKKIASIVDQSETVKWKKKFYQGWRDVKIGDELSQDDEVYTHTQSSTKIIFINGTEIDLFENSLLRIKSDEKKNSLALDRGNIIAKFTNKSPILDIQLGSKRYSFKSENARLQIEQNEKENKFLLLDGKAKFADKDILKNQFISQNLKTGAIIIDTIPFIPLLPADNAKVYYRKKSALSFRWESSGSSKANLQISRDLKFHNLIFNEAIEGLTKTVELDSSGIFYWRLVNDNFITGPIKSFLLIEESPLAVETRKTILYQSPTSTDNVILFWKKGNAKSFLIKIESPERTLRYFKTNKNIFDFTPKTIGDYLISVKIDERNRPLAMWSEEKIITLKNENSIAISRITPELVEEVRYDNQLNNYHLFWNGPDSGVSYKVTVTHNGKTTTNEEENNYSIFKILTPGVYQWDVQAKSPSGVMSNKLSGKVIIKTPLNISQIPSEGAVIELEKPDQLVSFKWSDSQAKYVNGKKYQFELSSTPLFKNIIHTEDTEEKTISTIISKIGRYYWRVKIKGGDSVEYSLPIAIEIKPIPPLQRPATLPAIKIKLKQIDKKSTLLKLFNPFEFIFPAASAEEGDTTISTSTVAEWDVPANRLAKSYIVEIFMDENLTNLITRIESSTSHIVWDDAISGKFYWRVSYVDYWGRKTDFSDTSTLLTENGPVADNPPAINDHMAAIAEAQVEKSIQEKPEEIYLLLPHHYSTVLEKADDRLTFEWKEVSSPLNLYTLIIAADLEFKKIVWTKNISNNHASISCAELHNLPGSFYWKVVSGEKSSKRRFFKVICATVPEKKSEKIEIAVSAKPKEIVIKKLTTKRQFFLRIGFSPHGLNYQNKANSYSAKVDGFVLNSWQGMFQTPLNWNYFKTMNVSLWASRGKVFHSIIFNDLELDLRFQRHEKYFNWGPVAFLLHKNIYIESNLAITNNKLTTPLAGAFIKKGIGKSSFEFEIKLGQMMGYQARVDYYLKNHFSVGAFLNYLSVTKDNNRHSFTRYGLNLNYTFGFLNK